MKRFRQTGGRTTYNYTVRINQKGHIVNDSIFTWYVGHENYYESKKHFHSKDGHAAHQTTGFRMMPVYYENELLSEISNKFHSHFCTMFCCLF